MTQTTEDKALALVNEIQDERGKGFRYLSLGRLGDSTSEALCRTIDQRDATKREFDDFKQKVSDVAHRYIYGNKSYNLGHSWGLLLQFIIPKPTPDPLVEALKSLAWDVDEASVNQIRAALAARNLKIVEVKNDDQ